MDPQIYSSGIGHNVLELAKRMQNKGHMISFGCIPPKDKCPVIFFKKHFLLRKKLSIRVLKISLNHPIVLIRSDLPIESRLIFNPDLEVMPSGSTVKKKTQKYIPPLPQRGIMVRNVNRGDVIKKIEVKCNPENIPSSMNSISAQLKDVDSGISLSVDSPINADGSDNNWHDFSQIDISLILRPTTPLSNDRKPPTRLINAWAAGTIPFVDPLPAYLELIRDGIDGFIIYEPEDVASFVKTLIDDPTYLAQVFANARKRGEEFDVDQIVEEWERSISGVSSQTRLSIRRKFLLILQFIKTLVQK